MQDDFIPWTTFSMLLRAIALHSCFTISKQLHPNKLCKNNINKKKTSKFVLNIEHLQTSLVAMLVFGILTIVWAWHSIKCNSNTITLIIAMLVMNRSQKQKRKKKERKKKKHSITLYTFKVSQKATWDEKRYNTRGTTVDGIALDSTMDPNLKKVQFLNLNPPRPNQHRLKLETNIYPSHI